MYRRSLSREEQQYNDLLYEAQELDKENVQMRQELTALTGRHMEMIPRKTFPSALDQQPQRQQQATESKHVLPMGPHRRRYDCSVSPQDGVLPSQHVPSCPRAHHHHHHEQQQQSKKPHREAPQRPWRASGPANIFPLPVRHTHNGNGVRAAKKVKPERDIVSL